MARADGRIEKGQRLATAISARAWNRAQEAADRVLGANPGLVANGQTLPQAPYTWVYARNDGPLAERFSVLTCDGIVIAYDGDDNSPASRSYFSMPCMIVNQRTTASSRNESWCVALEPIETGKIGRVAVGGVVQIRSQDFPNASGARIVCKETTTWQASGYLLVDMNGGIVRATIPAGIWNAGTLKTVKDTEDQLITYSARNSLATMNFTADTNCLIVKAANEWDLLSFSTYSFPGFVFGNQQVLVSDLYDGHKWVNIEDLPLSNPTRDWVIELVNSLP